MKTVIIIPARLAAMRLPQKPLALIKGEPMITHVIQRAKEAKCGKVVVACCGPEIQSIAEQESVEVLLTDPHLPSGTDRVHAASLHYPDAEVIINLQGDLPFVEPKVIQSVLKPLTNPLVDIATVAAPIRDEEEINNPNIVKIAMTFHSPQTAKAHYFSRSPIPYNSDVFYHHIGIYAFRKAALEKFVQLKPSPLELSERLEQLRALEEGLRIDVELVDSIPQTVDTQKDLDKLNN